MVNNMRLIDADKARKEATIDLVVHLLDRQPTIDAVPVRRGKWILHDNGDATCDQCHRWQKDIWDFDTWQNFCGHCGADMRGE